ncbi:MAG: hypothetical protein GKS07_07455 [Nitrosopumilus sp.]|nr:MAG: hypothetical protein GKS07_07455 [Nitrosopumilus sp.]
MRYRPLPLMLPLLLLVGILAGLSYSDHDAFGAKTGSANYCNVFPTFAECSGWRSEPISDNHWFCQYVDLSSSTVCDNPPDPEKLIITRIGNHCCGIIDSHPLKDISLADASFADASEKGKSLESSSSSSSSFSGQELIIWTERDHYLLGDRVNVYGKFDFNDPVLQNNNSLVEIRLNDVPVVLDLPVHSNGWFAGHFVLSNPYLFYTGSNLISVTYFHTPNQHESDKFAHATYAVTTGDISVAESFYINVESSASDKISVDIISESGDDSHVNVDSAIIRLKTPDGLIFSLPSVSSIDDVSDYLDFSLIAGQYEITVTKGNSAVSQSFEYVR